MSPTPKPHTRVWRDPLTHQDYTDVPLRLADRLDSIATAARPRPGEGHSIERSVAQQAVREQLQHLLSAFGYRNAYRRLVDELHAGEDGLLPISEDRRGELRHQADTFAALRDLSVTWAVREGASIEDAALAAGITLNDAVAAVAREGHEED